MEQVRLADLADLPIKEKSAKSARPDQGENLFSEPKTVEQFFSNPPSWLPGQLGKYREDPEMHFGPLCTAVAAVVLGVDGRAEDVAEEVERELAERPDHDKG